MPMVERHLSDLTTTHQSSCTSDNRKIPFYLSSFKKELIDATSDPTARVENKIINIMKVFGPSSLFVIVCLSANSPVALDSTHHANKSKKQKN